MSVCVSVCVQVPFFQALSTAQALVVTERKKSATVTSTASVTVLAFNVAGLKGTSLVPE